jgi:hypothetical protein
MTRNLDDLIDSVAREMTEAPAPVDLRARVIAEVRHEGEAEASFHRSESRVRRTGAWGWKPVAWLAAAAGILLAAYLTWPERQPAAPTIVQAPVRTQAPVEEPPTRRAPTTASPERGRAARGARAPRDVASAPEETVASIPALAEPPALDIAPLDAGAREIPQLEAIAPLDTAALEIKPLTPFQ